MKYGYIRTCEKCGETKPLFFFRREPRIECGYSIKCVECERVDRERYRKAVERGRYGNS